MVGHGFFSILLTCLLEMPIFLTSLVDGLVRTPTPFILSFRPYRATVSGSLSTCVQLFSLRFSQAGTSKLSDAYLL